MVTSGADGGLQFSSCYDSATSGCHLSHTDCKAAAAFARKWDEVDHVADLDPKVAAGFAALGWDQAAWEGCKECYKVRCRPTKHVPPRPPTLLMSHVPACWPHCPDAATCCTPQGMWETSSHTLKECIYKVYSGPFPNPLCPASEIKSWAQLTDSERAAAIDIGFTQALWDASSPYSCCHAPDELELSSPDCPQVTPGLIRLLPTWESQEWPLAPVSAVGRVTALPPGRLPAFARRAEG